MKTSSSSEIGNSAAGIQSAPQAVSGAAAQQRLLLLLLLLALACGAALLLSEFALRGLDSPARVLLGVALFLLLAAPAAWYLVLLPLAGTFERHLAEQVGKTRHAEERLRAHENDARLQHALEIAEDEAAVLRIAEQALKVMANDSGAQLLLATDPDGEINQSITVGDMSPAARCTIRRPRECPTVRRGQGLVYEDSMALSACPGLGGQIDASCAAACTPVFVGGRGSGMMRALGTTGDAALYRQLQSLTFNAHQIGTRLAVIRSVAASELKATTDPLTGLYNRRALDARLALLLDRQTPFALAIADIDHFKKVNDNHGHEVGDAALKVLAATLKQAVRREDLVCRFGGEEFVMLLTDLDVARGVDLVERIRAELPRAVARAGVPAFTISAGVVDHQHANEGETLLRIADGLLYEAKTLGRDRVLAAPPLNPAESNGVEPGPVPTR